MLVTISGLPGAQGEHTPRQSSRCFQDGPISMHGKVSAQGSGQGVTAAAMSGTASGDGAPGLPLGFLASREPPVPRPYALCSAPQISSDSHLGPHPMDMDILCPSTSPCASSSEPTLAGSSSFGGAPPGVLHPAGVNQELLGPLTL